MATSRASLQLCVGSVLTLFIICSVSETAGASTTKSKTPQASVPTKNTVMHANFKDAGKKAGLQIWRIEVSLFVNVFIMLN